MQSTTSGNGPDDFYFIIAYADNLVEQVVHRAAVIGDDGHTLADGGT